MADLEEIYAIFKTKEVFQGGYMRFLKSDLKKELFSGNYIYRDGAYISWIDKGKYIKLKKFVSLYEGQGYGLSVFREFMDCVVGDKDVYLKVLKSNQRAIDFYEKNSFVCMFDCDRYYQYVFRKSFLL